MSDDKKRGRRFQNKPWDLRLRHIFSAGYVEDADLHALMFVSGDHFTAIMQRALREFAANHDLPTIDNDFQCKMYFAASTLIGSNRKKPDQIDVLQSMDESELIDRICELANANVPQQALSVVSASIPVDAIQPPQQEQPAEPSSVSTKFPSENGHTPAHVKPKTRLQLPEMDFGPEIDEEALLAGVITEIKRAPLKDRWLARHKK